MKSVGGSSATNLISRFANGNNAINELLYEIVDKENQHEKNLVSAEIVHLPETRTGNILLRPHLRKYEIPILTSSTLNFANQLPLNDLMISIQNNRIVLRSKKLKKGVIPYLSNAHNYSNKSLPAYHLLADLQNQDLRNTLFLNWGFLKTQFNYFPRVTYGKIIVSLAFWQIYQDELKLIINNKSFEMNEYLKLITKRRIPRDVLLVEGDNELYINNENSESVKMLLSIVKNKPSFILKEFLFADTNQLVLDTDGNPYTNEFIFSFYKN